MKKVAALLACLLLVVALVPGMGQAGELADKASSEAMWSYWEKYWTDGPVVSAWDAAADTTHYLWLLPENLMFKHFGVFDYKSSQNYVGTTAYSERYNPYNSNFPYNDEAVFTRPTA